MKWFRMYTSLVDSVKVGTLTDGAFRAYVELLCLAGEKSDGGRTGVTPKTINWRLRRDVLCDVTATVTASLVTQDSDDGEYIVLDWDKRQVASDTSAARTKAYRARQVEASKSLNEKDVTACDVTVTVTERHGDALEEIREEEKREEKATSPTADAVPVKKSVPDCPAQALVDLYHELLPLNPQCLVLNDKRRGTIKARWREWFAHGKIVDEKSGMDFFKRFFGYVSGSDFLMGRTAARDGRPPFIADIDFLFAPESHVKIIEGKYHEVKQ